MPSFKNACRRRQSRPVYGTAALYPTTRVGIQAFNEHARKFHYLKKHHGQARGKTPEITVPWLPSPVNKAESLTFPVKSWIREALAFCKKGIKFVATPHTIDRGDLQLATDDLARRLHLNLFFHGGNSTTRDPNFRIKSTWMPPSSNTFSECELKILDSAVKNIPNALTKRNLPKTNGSP